MKMSIFAISFALLCIAAMSFAMPSLLDKPDTLLPIDDSEAFVPMRSDRHARATCDLLSFDTKFGSLNHSACAAHCLVLGKGFRGGRCRDGVCHCRK